MKRDENLLNTILKAAESCDDVWFSPYDLAKSSGMVEDFGHFYNEDDKDQLIQCEAHMRLLADQGLFQYSPGEPVEGDYFDSILYELYRLTSQGHDYLKNIQ